MVHISQLISQMLDGESNINSPLWLIRQVRHEGKSTFIYDLSEERPLLPAWEIVRVAPPRV